MLVTLMLNITIVTCVEPTKMMMEEFLEVITKPPML